jgi:hypothetical protein
MGAPGAPGATGATGPQGPQGPQGLPGQAGLSGYQRVSSTFNIPASFLAQLDLGCPFGKRVLSGGLQIGDGTPIGTQIQIVVRQSYAISDSVWRTLVSNTHSAPVPLTVHAICATAN